MPQYQNSRKVRRLTDETKAQNTRMSDESAMLVAIAIASALIGRAGVYVSPSNYGRGIRMKFYAGDDVSEGSWSLDEDLAEEMQYAVDEGVSLEAGKHFERLLAAWRAERASEPRKGVKPIRGMGEAPSAPQKASGDV